MVDPLPSPFKALPALYAVSSVKFLTRVSNLTPVEVKESMQRVALLSGSDCIAERSCNRLVVPPVVMVVIPAANFSKSRGTPAAKAKPDPALTLGSLWAREAIGGSYLAATVATIMAPAIVPNFIFNNFYQ